MKTTAGSPFRTEWTSLFASDWNFRNARGDKAEDADIKTSTASEKAAVDQLTEKVSKLDQDRAAMQKEHEQLESEYSDKMEAFTRLQNKHSELQVKYHKMDSQYQQDKLSFNILVDKLHNTQAEKDKLFQEASVKQILINELDENIATLQQHLAGLKTKHHELTVKHSGLQEAINSYSMRLHDTHSSMATAEKSLAAEKSNLTDAEQKITSLQQLHSDIKERQIACEKDHHTLVLQISETSKEYKQQLFEKENGIVLAMASASKNLEPTNLEDLRNAQENLIADKQAFQQSEQQLTQLMNRCFECLFMLFAELDSFLVMIFHCTFVCRVNSPETMCNEIASNEAPQSLHVNSQHSLLPEPASQQGIEQEAKPEAEDAEVARKQALATKKLASSLTPHALALYLYWIVSCF